MTLYSNTITYWSLGPLDKYGKPTYTAPVTFSGRWQASAVDTVVPIVQYHDISDAANKSVVYTDSTIDFVPKAFLYRGTSDTADPLNVEQAYPIRKVQVSTNIQGDKIIKKIFL